MTTSKRKRQSLLTCARKGMTLAAVNRRLQKECLDSVNEYEWNLWLNYYVDITRNDPYFEHELIDNNRSLAWFAKELNRRKQKTTVS